MIKFNIDNSVGNNDFSESVKLYYNELKKYQPISKERERELLSRAKKGDIEARNEIITANLRFVFDIAKKYRGRGVDICDLISEGNKGIIKAIEKFDMSKDVIFFTYSVWWIRQHMMQAINENSKYNKNEVNFDDAFPEEYMSIENVGYDNSDEQESNEVNSDYGIADSDDCWGEYNEDTNQKSFVVKKLLAKLDKRERLVIMKYYGIENDDDGESLEEISKKLNLSTERIRQIKIKAIDAMRSEVFNIKEASFLFN